MGPLRMYIVLDFIKKSADTNIIKKKKTLVSLYKVTNYPHVLSIEKFNGNPRKILGKPEQLVTMVCVLLEFLL